MRCALDRIWRTLATGLCFVVFGVGGLLLTLFATPLLYLSSRSRAVRARRTRRLISRSFAMFIELMRLLGVAEYRLAGGEQLRRHRCLVIANHPSLIDVVFLIAFIPDVDCVIKRALWRNPVTGIPVRLAGYISNAAAPELMACCQQRLADDHSLIIFPEGTRSLPGQPLKFQRGAAHIALAADAELIPVTIVFREATLTKDQRWYHVPSRKISVSISVDRPIDLNAYRTANEPTVLAARRLTAALQRYFTDRLAAAADEQAMSEQPQDD